MRLLIRGQRCSRSAYCIASVRLPDRKSASDWHRLRRTPSQTSPTTSCHFPEEEERMPSGASGRPPSGTDLRALLQTLVDLEDAEVRRAHVIGSVAPGDQGRGRQEERGVSDQRSHEDAAAAEGRRRVPRRRADRQRHRHRHGDRRRQTHAARRPQVPAEGEAGGGSGSVDQAGEAHRHRLT